MTNRQVETLIIEAIKVLKKKEIKATRPRIIGMVKVLDDRKLGWHGYDELIRLGLRRLAEGDPICRKIFWSYCTDEWVIHLPYQRDLKYAIR